MKYVFFDGSSGLSGDMILGALLDLGVDPKVFREKMARLRLPVEIAVRNVRRGALRALQVDVHIDEDRQVERTFRDVERLIARSRFSSAVKDKALAVFRRLFEAEAKVHGRRFAAAHLHEAGADDALVDIVGCAVLSEELGIGEYYASPLNVGSGWVKTSHGVLPVPPPAVAELLKGAPVYSAHVESELVTPTGAAIVSTLVGKFSKLPEIVYDRIGCGAGSKNFPEMANVLRVFYGQATGFHGDGQVYVIEATLDDASPQLLARFLEKALEEGALDAALSPVVMKKNRLGTKLTLLAAMETMDRLIESVFRETTSIGVRYHPVGRRVLEREFESLRVGGERVRVKVGSLDGRAVNIQPEFEDCVRAARKTGRPLKEIAQLAVREYYRRR